MLTAYMLGVICSQENVDNHAGLTDLIFTNSFIYKDKWCAQYHFGLRDGIFLNGFIAFHYEDRGR